MVLYESLCAAALSVGSAVCLAKLLAPQQQALNSSSNNNNSSSDPFFATLLITCLMGAFALWTVKGPHACWHPSSGSPGRGSGSSSSSSTISVVAPPQPPPAGTRAPKGDAVANRAADKASGGTTEPKTSTTTTTMMAHGADPALLQCGDEDDGDAYASEDEGPPMDDVRLERQSSFVVSLFCGA